IINLPNQALVRIMADVTNRVYIFDTTLRDGEQSPGCSMTVPEKLRMARKLVELGVDILEAGFPIASEGDFEAVDAVSREFHWAIARWSASIAMTIWVSRSPIRWPLLRPERARSNAPSMVSANVPATARSKK